MASTPPTNEAFLREVDEELRRDQALGIWRTWGRWIIGAVVAGLVALGGGLYWQSQRDAQLGVDGEHLAQALDDLAADKAAAAKPALDGLVASKSAGYRASAKLALASMALQKDDIKGAAAQFGAIAADTSLPQAYRDLALVRQTAAEYDSLKPEQVIARLKPLAIPKNPWFGSAGEMVAVAYLRMNKPDLAGATFSAMMSDETVPSTIRSRVQQLSGSLGVNPASAPGTKTDEDKH